MRSGWQGGETASPEESMELGESLADFLESGDILALRGDLAAGKTTFVKGILKGLNYQAEVTSPTFTLINEYDADKRVIHIDCYREENVESWLNLGVQEYFYNDDIVIIEWPEIISKILPHECIKINLKSTSENGRSITIR